MNTSKKEPFLECIDHTVSQEKFALYLDEQTEMLITTPKPQENRLHKYYESEDYISHTDAKRSLIEHIYQLVKKYALKQKVKLITDLNGSAGRILDIGAGTGDFLVAAASNKWDSVGVEPSKSARALAKNKGIELFTNTSDLSSQSFDVITMWHVLEHVPVLETQIDEIKRLLKPNGHLIIAVPNYKSYDANYYKSFWAAYDVPRHLWHFSKKSIEVLFKSKNIALKTILPMPFDAFYVAMLSEKYKTGKINYFKAFYIGFLSNLKGIRTKEYSSHIYVLKN